METSSQDFPQPTRRRGGVSPGGEKPHRKLEFVHLPLETQKQIIRHVNWKDLFTLQRVSAPFFYLATAEIYRDLNLNITNSGDEELGLPRTHAAEALQTILASEHDYGSHIKTLRIGVAEDNIEQNTSLANSHRNEHLLMTRLLWDSKSDSSKFLNTSLLLVARKAWKLETFQWDAPIELSGAVYQALHKIQSLRHLRVRLDVTPSPRMVIRNPTPHPPPPHHHAQAVPTPSQYIPPLPIPSGGSSSSYPGHSSKVNNIKRKKIGGGGGYNYWANNRAFSGFKTLTSLALMGLSNLECLGEISECIKASSGSLNSLTLSLSTELAKKARKPVPVNPDLDDPSDTELDEEDMLNDPMPPSASTVQPVTNEADIRKEKLAQESILAKIFDLQSVSAEGKRLEKTLSLSTGRYLEEEETHATTRKLDALMKSLIDAPAASDDASSNAARLEHFKMVRDIADMYITSQTVQKKSMKEQIKTSLPPGKKNGSAPKPPNPVASGMEPSASSSSTANMMDWDLLGPALGSTASMFDPGLSGGLSNGTPKFNVPGNGYPMSNGSLPSPYFTGKAGKMVQVQQMLQQAVIQNQKAQIASMSPSFAGSSSNAVPSSTALPVPYEQSHPSSPGQYHEDLLFSPYPHSSSNGLSNPYLNEDGTALGAKNGMPSISKKAKTKVSANKKSSPVKVVLVDSEDECDTPPKSPASTQQPFFAADSSNEPVEDTMDIDMVHPDEDTADLGEDQEMIAEPEDGEVTTPRKRAKIGEVEVGSTSIAADKEPVSPPTDVAAEPLSKPTTPDEAMHSYIRATHGLHLEELSLEWVPLKASIVARALDLSVLKRLTLLEVGPQDAFWTLLARLQGSSAEIGFKSIHTDNVSLPFLKFLATFEGLEGLYMHERASKQDAESGGPQAVNITFIRKMALQKHISTLKRLMIKNDRNDSWDVDVKTLQFLAYRGAGLIELAISLNMKTYHLLMQLFYGFKNLYALHLINLRTADRHSMLHSESLSFAVDSLSHCPNMRIKYIALVNQVVMLETKPPQFNKALQLVMEKRNRDKKGKGKATSDAISSLMEAFEDSDSDGSSEFLADVMAGDHKIRFASNFAATNDVEIFTKEIRLGKL